MKTYLILFALILSPVFAYGQEGTPGIVTSNINGADYVEYSLVDRGVTKSYRIQSTHTGTRQFLFAEANGDYSPKWSGSNVNFLRAVNTYFSVADGNSTYVSFEGNQTWTQDHDVAVTNNNYYTIIVGVNANENNAVSILETSYLPQSISSVSSAGIVYAGQSLTVTVTMSGEMTNLGSDERLYLRYSSDDFATSSFVEITSLNGSFEGTALIPGFSAGTTVQYYVLTSNTTPNTELETITNINHTNADYFTLNFKGNAAENVGGNNFSYTVQSWETTQDGDWNTASTWTANAVPSTSENLGAVTIAHNVTLNQNASVSSLSIAAEKTLNLGSASLTSSGAITVTGTLNAQTSTVSTASVTIAGTLDAGSATISILDDGSLTNNGTFTYGTSTVHLLGDGVVSGSSTTDFYNLIADGQDGGPDFGAAVIPNTSTIYNKLTIANGGYLAEDTEGTGVSSSVNLPNYDANATLAIAGPFEVNSYASGWGDSGAKNPTKIEVGATGDISLATIARTVSGRFTVVGNTFTADGNLTVKSGAEVFVSGGSIDGSIIFEQEVTGTAGWRLLGVPVSSTPTFASVLNNVWTQGLSDASTTNGSSNVLVYNGSAFEAPTNLASTVSAGQGFAVNLYADNDFDGEADAFPRLINVTGTVANGDVTPTLNQGMEVFTLLGNPHPATIDYDLVTKGSVSDVVYVYDSSVPGYISWNGTTGGLTDGLIAPFQGFFVYNMVAGETTIAIPLSAKTSGGTFYKAVERPLISLFAESNGMKSATYFSFSETGLEAKDAHDAFKLSPLDHKNFLSLASHNGSSLLDINNLPLDLQSQVEIPVHVTAYEANQNNLSWSVVGGDVLLTWDAPKHIPSSWTVELLDNVTGNRVNMLQVNQYAFTLEPSAAKVAFENTLNPKGLTAVSDARFSLIVGPVVTSISEISELPTSVRLNQNYPNPFNPSTEIAFELPDRKSVV